jgi:glycosyltransferase involved in cell wall biosynthesis
MQIALLSAEYPPQPGGVGDYTRRLGRALVERGHDVRVYTICDARFQIINVASASTDHETRLDNQRSDWGWGSWRHVIAALDLTRPDVLHIQYQTGAYQMRPAINLLPWRLGGLPRRPAIVVTAHDLLLPYLFPKAGPLRAWITRRLLADADAVIATNQADFAKIAGWRSAIGDRGRCFNGQSLSAGREVPVLIPIGSNIAVAPPPDYDRAAWRARLGVAAGDMLIAYFGLISHTKGLDILLAALARLPDPFRLLIVGGAASTAEDRAYAQAISRQIADDQLQRRVTITGHCTEAEVSAHLLAADLAVLPFTDGASFRRGSMLAILAHGLPTVTTTLQANDQRIEPVPGRLVDGDNILLIPPNDVDALGAAIERTARDAELREQLSAGGRALAAQFAWPEIAARHEQLYARLTQR